MQKQQKEEQTENVLKVLACVLHISKEIQKAVPPRPKLLTISDLLEHEVLGLIAALQRDMANEQRLVEQDPTQAQEHGYNVYRDKQLLSLIDKEVR